MTKGWRKRKEFRKKTRNRKRGEEATNESKGIGSRTAVQGPSHFGAPDSEKGGGRNLKMCVGGAGVVKGE